jgi:ribose 5-phosphate isomerase B
MEKQKSMLLRNQCFKKILVGSDHRGYHLKQIILEKFPGIAEDYGTNSPDVSVDYPDYAQKVINNIQTINSCGVLICKTGVGMSIAANKSIVARSLLCSGNIEITRLARAHNNCNVICFGANFILPDQALKCLEAFITTNFELQARHIDRLNKLKCFHQF